MKTSSYSSCIEALETRLAPAGIIAVSVNSAGTLTLANIAGQDGDEAITIERFGDGSFQLTPGSGVTLRIGGTDFTTPQILFGITGLTANLGAGNDTVILNDCIFSKAATVNLGNGNNSFVMSSSMVTGTLLVTAGTGDDLVSFDGSASGVGGAVTIKLGAGQDAVTSSVNRLTLNAGLTFDGGAGNDILSLAVTDSDDVYIVGNLKFIGGAGDDILAIGTTNTTFGATGSVMLTDTAGNETVTITGTRFDTGALSLLAGAGTNSLTTSATDLVVARNFQWTSGTGTDTVDINGTNLRVGGTLDIALGAGPGSASLDATALVQVSGALKLSSTGGAGAARDLTIDTGVLVVGGKLTLSGGAGNGDLDVFGGTVIQLGLGAAFTSGLGATDQKLSTNGVLISIGAVSMTHAGNDGRLSVFGGGSGDSVIKGALTMKGGDDQSITLTGTITGAVTLTTAANPVDAPQIAIAGNGQDGLSFVGAVKATLTSVAGGTGRFFIQAPTFESTASFIGGAGADEILLDNLVALKAVTVNLGAGADHFRIETNGVIPNSTYFGSLTMLGGAGADLFTIGGDAASQVIDFRNAVTANGGADTDTLTVGTQVTFAPGFPLKQISIP
jgi:hypothetical protein